MRSASHPIILQGRLSGGLQLDANYTYGNRPRVLSLRENCVKRLDTGTPGNVTQAFKSTWVWELPFGRGRRWLHGGNGSLDRVIGGSEVDGTGRVQTGRLVDLGNVRVVGMTIDQLRDSFTLRPRDGIWRRRTTAIAQRPSLAMANAALVLW